MVVNNWLYLLLGVGLGLGSGWLLGRSKSHTKTFSPTKEVSDDVSTLSKQLQQTQQAYQLAHEMSQFKAGFLVRTSHELRSPLNSLIGLHQLILADLCDDHAEERNFVAQAHSCAMNLMKLLDRVLDVARVEHGTNILEVQPVQLAQMLQEVYQLTSLLAANRSFNLQLRPCEPDIYVLVDPRWLRQVLVNLIDSCIEQMQEGSIYIAAEPQSVTEAVHIWLDVRPSISAWSEPMDLMQSEQASPEAVLSNATLSPGLNFLLNQSLLKSMQGCLKILAVPTQTDESSTRIEVTIPLLIPETAFPDQEEN